MLKCVVLIALKLSYIEMRFTSEARVEASIINTSYTEGEINLPEDITLRIVTDLENYTFGLRLNRRNFQRVPVVNKEGNTWQRHSYEMIKNGVGVYGTTNASFVLKFNDVRVVLCKGFFYNSTHVFNVHPSDAYFTSHVIYIQPHRDYEFSTGESHLTNNETEVLQLKTNIPPRWKRQTQLYEVELLIVVDFALLKQFAETTLNLDDVIEDIVHQFAIIVSGIEARFKGIKGSGYLIDVVAAGIYIAKDVQSSSWSESVKETSQSRPVISEKSIKLLAEWINVNQHNLPEFDHAMAFTAYNLRKEDNHKTLGLGYKQSMCTDRRFSIVEHHGDAAYASYIATHELAHSLGAKHDGYPARVMYGGRVETCSADEGYIMCAKATKDPDQFLRKWTFSDCSVLYFDFFLDYLNENKSNCMTQRSSWHSGNDSTMYINESPIVYSPDEQCERKHGTGSVLDRTAVEINNSGICPSIPCVNPRDLDSFLPTLPLEGTVCGQRKLCHRGRCVNDDTPARDEKELSNDECIFGDQPGVISGTERTCKDLWAAVNLAYRCYTYDKQCCHTCAWHRRQFSAIDACPYGDKKESCSSADCGTEVMELCCETCAISAGILKMCPVLQAPDNGLVSFNTNTNYHGRVAYFSCSYGWHVAGNKTATCLQDGTWSSAVPKCAKGCLIPKLPPQKLFKNEFDNGLYTVGSVINFECQNGLVIEGNATTECKENSLWSSTVPKCMLVFTSPSVIHVLENIESGSVVHQLLTGNASTVYKLLYYSHQGFTVTEDGKVVVSFDNLIDFEGVPSYSLTVEATSKTTSRLKARQRLGIHVQDVNEFEPIFTVERYCIILDRPYIDGMFVLQVSATDQDASGFNISYKIRNSAAIDDVFRIDLLTGVINISNAKQLNNSKLSEYFIEVQGADSGKPQLKGTCTVVIKTMGRTCQQNATLGLSQKNFQTYITLSYLVMYNVYVYFLFSKRLLL